jgi:hypothetical protein
MTVTFSAPSKTFLAGEYAVLGEAPALILNTGPRFELVARKGPTQSAGFPEESPAGLWLKEREPLLEGWTLEFRDPHNRQGGFGASSAQFIFVHSLTTYLQSSFAKITEVFDRSALWKDHQVLTKHRGSGADVLAQLAGQVALVDVRTIHTRALKWPYPELGFGIVRTHQKVRTHEHLAQIDRKAMSLLVRPAQACVESFGNSSSEVFVSRLKTFAGALKEFDLQAPASLNLIRLFEDQPWCLCAKGCGALGADTLLFIYPTEEKEKMNTFVRKQHLTLVATSQDLSPGLEMRLSVGAEDAN